MREAHGMGEREIEKARARLIEAAKRYHAADEQRRKALEALRVEMRRADAAGMMRKTIVRESGVARQTVWDALAEGE